MIFLLASFILVLGELDPRLKGTKADPATWGDLDAFLKDYAETYVSSADGGLDVRVAKAMYSKGYAKVRVSVITQSSSAPSGLNWDVSERFSHYWTDNYIHSKIIDVTPGTTTTLNINGQTIDIKIPAENKGTRGIMFADPCIQQSSWCIYANKYDILGTSTDFLNTVMKMDGMDWWYVVGDNFYDRTGDYSKSYFDRLTLDTKSKPTGMVLGNHDFWIGGSPGAGSSSDQLGIGMTQFWAQDTVASFNHPIFDWSISPWGKYRDPNPPIATENTIWWYKIGNLGFIGYSGANYESENRKYFDQMCQQFSSDGNIKTVFILGHWDTGGDGCQSGLSAPEVINTLRGMPSCSGIKDRLLFVDGHTHVNEKQGSDGFMIGANGMRPGNGHFGHIYVKSSDDGTVEVWYFEFANPWSNHWSSIKSCIESNDIDDCTHLATKWYGGNPNPGPSPSGNCDSNGAWNHKYAGQYTCGARISWEQNYQGKTWQEAYNIVHGEYPSICTCSSVQTQVEAEEQVGSIFTSAMQMTKTYEILGIELKTFVLFFAMVGGISLMYGARKFFYKTSSTHGFHRNIEEEI